MQTLQEWRERRVLLREIKQLKKSYTAKKDTVQAQGKSQLLSAHMSELVDIKLKLKQLETKQINRRATKLGIKIPTDDKEVWYTQMVSGEDGPEAVAVYSQEGKRRMGRLIRDERRSNVEFWIKILSPIIAALTGLTGAIIGLLAFLKK